MHLIILKNIFQTTQNKLPPDEVDIQVLHAYSSEMSNLLLALHSITTQRVLKSENHLLLNMKNEMQTSSTTH